MSSAADRIRAEEYQEAVNEKRLTALLTEYRLAFGAANYNGPMFNDWRRFARSTGALPQAIATIEGALRANKPLALDWFDTVDALTGGE